MATDKTNPHVPGKPVSVRVTRRATLPDQIRLTRFRRLPEYAPRVLFFSGGTALNALARKLVSYTHNSIHITTPFDSGGSSGKLRDPFGILGVGDLRSRMMALADRSAMGQAAIVDLFAYRFPVDEAHEALQERLRRMVKGQDERAAAIHQPMRDLICNHLRYFQQHMPPTFDLRGASIGNLIIAGGFVNNRSAIEPVVYLFSKLAEVRGTVLPAVAESLQLCAELADGTRLVGQHLITGKECPPIQSSIVDLYVVDGVTKTHRVDAVAGDRVLDMISRAELICYPMGSFFTSIIANLLPTGVCQAIAENGCPKIYVPNTLADPEQHGLTLAGCVETLYAYLRKGANAPVPIDRVLTHILIDTRSNAYAVKLDLDRMSGFDVVDTALVTRQTFPRIDEELLIHALLSMV